MDRNLFRAKRGDTGEWVKGALVYLEYADVDCRGSYIIPKHPLTGHGRMLSFDLAFYAVKVDPDTIGQCTGITDRHNILIFEGDILSDGVDEYKVKYIESSTGFTAYRYTVSSNCYCWSLYHLSIGKNQKRQIEIIGNIYDK